MTHPTFIQNAWLGGRAIFHVSGAKIEISSRSLGQKLEAQFLLSELSPVSRRISEFKPKLALILFGMAFLAGNFVWWLHDIDEHLGKLIVHYCYPFIAIPVALGVRALFPFVRFEFRKVDGGAAFQIFEEVHQKKACAAFVAQLSLCIEAAKGSVLTSEIGSLLDRLEPTSTPVEHRWKGSMIFGALAVLLPPIPSYADVLGGVGVLVVMGCTIGSMIFCAVSFSAKERFRWLSLLGASMGLVPPFFY